MVWQTQLILAPRPRGFHIITEEIRQALAGSRDRTQANMPQANIAQENMPQTNIPKTGLLHIFIQHTSASLAINESADPSVRRDFEAHFNRMVPEDPSLFEHTLEGSDDMTSHLKSSMLGQSVTVPITNGSLNLGTWQGIWLCEHRNRGGSRRLILTVIGE